MADLVHASSGGLSTAHISPRNPADWVLPNLEVWRGASLMSAHRRRLKRPMVGGGLRGRIREFSWASRRRLQRSVAKVRREQLPRFVTLTYPGEYAQDDRRWKRDLDAWCKRVRRRWPRAAGHWRLEFQKRGAPHYHLMLWGFGPPPGYSLEGLRRWVSRTWYEVVASGDERHLRAGTNVQEVRSYRGVQAYVAKALGRLTGELSKVQQALAEGVGRWWGVFNRAAIPWGDLVRLAVDNPLACDVIRYMRRFARLKTRAYSSLTVLCKADRWASALGLSP